MKTFNYCYGISLGNLTLQHSDNLSRTLQKADILAAEGQEVASMTLQTLKSLWSDANSKLFWTKATRMADKLEVSKLCLPRHKKVPRRLDDGSANTDFPATPEDHCRQWIWSSHASPIDLINQGLEHTRMSRNYILLKPANNVNCETELEFVTHFYGTDLNPQLLKSQLAVLSTNFKERAPANSHVVLSEVIDFFKTCTPAQQELLSEVCKLLRPLLVMHATNATSERSFSALRRIKSFLHSTMTQQRTNHLWRCTSIES